MSFELLVACCYKKIINFEFFVQKLKNNLQLTTYNLQLLKRFFFIFHFSFFIFFSANAQTDTGFVFVKRGKFKMGSNVLQADEKPQHKVKLNSFYISKYEVTNLQFAEFLNSEGNQFEGNSKWIKLNGAWRDEKCRIHKKDSAFFVEKGYENYPVSFVSWYGANAYCKWKGGRLPTEAEWEYVANLDNYFFENDIDSIAFHKNNSEKKINRVGQKLPTNLGIYDLYGNMSEWCSDWYSPIYYKNSPRKNPQGAEVGQMKIKRGGSWYSEVESISPTNRKASNPNNNNITIGFRVVKDIID